MSIKVSVCSVWMHARCRRNATHSLTLLFSKNVYSSSLSSFFTFYLIEKFNLPVQAAQVQLFIFMAAIAVGTLIGGALTDRSRSRKIMNGMSEIDRPAVVKATLIICPLSIQQQWEDEILTHAPALKVFKYNGCSTIFVSVI